MFLLKKLSNFLGFITTIVVKWLIFMKKLVLLPLFLSFHVSYSLRNRSNWTFNFRASKRTIAALIQNSGFLRVQLYGKQYRKRLSVKRAVTSLSKISFQLYGKDKDLNGTIFLVLKEDLLWQNLLLLFQVMFPFAIFQCDLTKANT